MPQLPSKQRPFGPRNDDPPVSALCPLYPYRKKTLKTRKGKA